MFCHSSRCILNSDDPYLLCQISIFLICTVHLRQQLFSCHSFSFKIFFIRRCDIWGTIPDGIQLHLCHFFGWLSILPLVCRQLSQFFIRNSVFAIFLKCRFFCAHIRTLIPACKCMPAPLIICIALIFLNPVSVLETILIRNNFRLFQSLFCVISQITDRYPVLPDCIQRQILIFLSRKIFSRLILSLFCRLIFIPSQKRYVQPFWNLFRNRCFLIPVFDRRFRHLFHLCFRVFIILHRIFSADRNCFF